MTTNPFVRSIRPDDLDDLLDLCREHAAYEGSSFREDGQVERWRRALFDDQPPLLFGWVAVDDSSICGFMSVTVDFATWSARRFAYMDCLYIRDTHRGRGLGAEFLSSLRDFGASQQCEWAEWQTPPLNELGIGFYRHMEATSLPKVRFRYDLLRQVVR